MAVNKISNICAAILVGGLGTRLRPITFRIPKPLVKVAGKPFLHYLLSSVKSMGINECILLSGYKHKMIEKYCKSGEKWGLLIKYSREPSPYGTGGALVLARRKIRSTALVLNGDSYLEIDLQKFLDFHIKKRAWVTIFSMKGNLEGRGALVVGKGGKVMQFLEKQKSGKGIFNTGAYLIEPAALEFLSKEIKAGRLEPKFSIEKEGFPLISKKGKLYSYAANGKFLDIGTFSSLLSAHKILPANSKLQGAIFLDRDGVINRHKHDYVLHPQDFEFEFRAIEGMRELAKLGMPIIIVTNQSMIGRRLSSFSELRKIHDKMLASFRKNNIKIKDIMICPHKPEDNCNCRKPKIGMLVEAAQKHNLDLSKSFVIGDSTGDILMGKTAGCTTILVKTGYGGKDKKHNVKPDYIQKDLLSCARLISKIIKNKKIK